MKIIGIETSCDETAASIVEDGTTLLSNVVASSMEIHAKYGGVVPEIAARSHIEAIMPVIDEALVAANTSLSDIDAIAVTKGAGLGGSLLIGVMAARTIAITSNKPLYGVNHVEGHVYANFLTNSPLKGYSFTGSQPTFPMLAIILSGKHTQLVLFKNHFDYEILGIATDDAVGEAFDKVAKMLGLPYPGGPVIGQLALKGNKTAYPLPYANVGTYDFSYSGLKTAVLRLCQSLIGENHTFPSTKLSERLNEAQKADIAASFEYTAIKTIVDKVKKANLQYSPASIVVAGGVAANQELRRQLLNSGLHVNAPDLKLCTDNGAMIATLGYYCHINGVHKADPFSLDIVPNLAM